MLDISFVDAELLREISVSCALQPADMLSVKIHSFPTFCSSYRCEWSVTDVATGTTTLHGDGSAGAIHATWCVQFALVPTGQEIAPHHG